MRAGRTLEVDEELGALEIAGRDAHVILGPRVVELGEAPVDEAQLRARAREGQCEALKNIQRRARAGRSAGHHRRTKERDAPCAARGRS